MKLKFLYVFVEGGDDRRFFNEVLLRFFQSKYSMIMVVKYAQKPKRFIEKLITNVVKRGNEYVFFHDLDNSICVTNNKKSIQQRFRTLDTKKMIVVVKEIEGWYLAGISPIFCQKMNIKQLPNANNLSKEEFDEIIPQTFKSTIDFKIEILKNYDIKKAIKNNRSFRYFMTKYVSQS